MVICDTDLESDKKGDSLDAVLSSVYIVTHEQVVGVWRLASDPEQLHQVVELTMNISTHSHWTFHLNMKTMRSGLLFYH